MTECTGERYLPEFDGDWTLEHLHRYIIACGLASDKVVLDIACGDGYGSKMLADKASRVIGVDINEEIISSAEKKYTHPRLIFKQGSATAIPLPDASVDLAVSFETIEHLAEHDEMLLEIRRVLRPDGLFLISSPDKHTYSELRGYENPYHVKELYHKEFTQLLQKHFRHVSILGQKVEFGSVMVGEEESLFYSWYKGWEKPVAGLADAHYLIALAGDGALPKLPSSILKGKQEESDLIRNLDKECRDLAKHLSYILEQLSSREIIYKKQEEEHLHLLERLAQQDRELTGVYQSHSWRITKPLRIVVGYLKSLAGTKKVQPGGSQPESASAQTALLNTGMPDVRTLQKDIFLETDTPPAPVRIGVFLHVFYVDLLEDMLACLRNLPAGADVYVSTDTLSKEQFIRMRLDVEGFQHAKIRLCPNRGWDIAPFLVGFAEEITKYDLVLRLHSKRSLHLGNDVGEAWRKMLFSSLAGSQERVNAIIRAFEDDSKLGMVCASHPPYYQGAVHFGGNLQLMKYILRQYDIDIQPDMTIDFPMGSMFWCRPHVLQPWLDQHLSYTDFTQNSAMERDGTLAHAFERLFFFGCGITGHSWARVHDL